MKNKSFSRRNFLKSVGMASSVLMAGSMNFACSGKKERPNILWVTSEDNSPTYVGCYGNPFATTPNIDRLASQGIVYENAFSTAPVCAPTRSTIITGVYPPSMGTQHMRSTNAIPDSITLYPILLRQAGYYCTNNRKEDYNIPKRTDIWDESSNKATYKNRKPGQPFFAIFNFTESHEHVIHTPLPLEKLRHDPAKVQLPPYQPDTPEIRHDWAQYYDRVEDMDKRVGEKLAELEKEGLAEDTIVFYYSDHGGVLPRSKRFCFDTGLKVPMVIHFPKKYQHLAPGKPGSRTDRPVSFIDLPPTLLSLIGAPIPKFLQGSAFAGKEQAKPREYVYSFRDRMDERYDLVRTVRDKKFRYRKNFMPHRIYGQHVWYLWKAPAMRSWEKMYKEGKCNKIQSLFWQPKPAEELYDTTADPWEVHNLADDPAHKDTLLRMRKACRDWIMEIRDTGFIPEGLMLDWAKKQTLYDLVHSDVYPLDRIVETAYMATDRNPQHLDELVQRLSDDHPVVRYWAATGCLVLAPESKSAIHALKKRLKDEIGDVRVTSAEALCMLGETKTGVPVLSAELSNENTKVALHAANSLECLGDAAKPALKALEAAQKNPDHYVQRAVDYTVEKLKA